MARKKKFKVFVVFGDRSTLSELGKDAVHEYEFNTQAEKDAFLLGVDECDGWSDYHNFDTEKAAKEFVAEQVGDEEGNDRQEE